MAEQHHDNQVSGEIVSPAPEPGAHTQADDIPVPFVAVVGLFFAALLVVSLVGLQAYFYNQANAEIEAKTNPQGAPGTDLSNAYLQWNEYLNAQGPKKDPTDPKGQRVNNVVPINLAIADIVKEYRSTIDAPPKVKLEGKHGDSR